MPVYYAVLTQNRTPSLTFDYDPANEHPAFSRARQEVDAVFSHYLPNISLNYGPSESKIWWENMGAYGFSLIYPGDKREMRLSPDLITSEELARSVYLHEIIHCFGFDHLALRDSVMWYPSLSIHGRRIIPFITDLCGFAHFYGYQDVVTDPALYIRKGSKNHLWIYIPALDVKGKIYTAFLKFGGVDGKPFWVIETIRPHFDPGNRNQCFIEDSFNFSNVVQGKRKLTLTNVQTNKGVYRIDFRQDSGRLYLEGYSRQ